MTVGSYRPTTVLVHGGTLRSQFGETSEALFLTQGFVYPTAEEAEFRFLNPNANPQSAGYQYSRFSNPTITMLEERMALLEGAEVVRATSSGMAAVTAALLCQLSAGDHLVASKALFGSCLYVIEDVCSRFGIASTLVDGTDLSQWQQAVRPNTRVFFLETPTNPTLEVYDISAIATIAHNAQSTLIVDNVFATPIYQSPLKLGADIVVYSTTKHIDGQGRCLGGLILCTQKFLEDCLQAFLRHTGPCLSPFNAWVMLKGLETLSLRVTHQTETAQRLAKRLKSHPGIIRLIYPGDSEHPQMDIIKRQMTGGSTLIAFEVLGGKTEAFRFLNDLRLIKISNNLGDAKSLITHPATTTHQRLSLEDRKELGISDNLLRLSVGLEDHEDLIEDLENALDKMLGS